MGQSQNDEIAAQVIRGGGSMERREGCGVGV